MELGDWFVKTLECSYKLKLKWHAGTCGEGELKKCLHVFIITYLIYGIKI